MHLAQPPLDRLPPMPSKRRRPALYLKPLVEREKNPLENTRVGKRQTPRRNLRTVNAHRRTGLSAHHRTLQAHRSEKTFAVDLTQYFLDRSQKLGPRYNAYALLTPEIAMAQAKAAEKEINASLSRPGSRNSLCRERSPRCKRGPMHLGRRNPTQRRFSTTTPL